MVKKPLANTGDTEMRVGSPGKEDPLDEDTATHSSIPVYILLIFLFISVDGHTGCFHTLAVVNSAAVNTGVHVSFSTMIFSGYMYPVVGLLGHMVVLFLVFFFKEISILFSIVAVSIYIPISCARISPFLHFLPSIYYL